MSWQAGKKDFKIFYKICAFQGMKGIDMSVFQKREHRQSHLHYTESIMVYFNLGPDEFVALPLCMSKESIIYCEFFHN